MTGAQAFCHSLIDALAGQTNTVGWKKDVYPSPDFLKNSICRGELFIAEKGDGIIAAMVLNREGNEGYRDFAWPTDAAPEEVTVIHALGVHPQHARQGVATRMVRFAIARAREDHRKVIRLDVLKGNTPAANLYTGLGFRYLHTLPMYYEDTGQTDFDLYELQL